MEDPDRAPSQSAGPIPVRRSNSVRRTSSIDTSWPEGRGGAMRMQGSARDIVMGREPANGTVTGFGTLEILASPSRQILALTSDPALAGLQDLIGVRGGGQSRSAIGSLLDANGCIGQPIHLLLDDFAGASLVAGWAWSRWTDRRAPSAPVPGAAANLPKMEGICAGFRPGASSLTDQGRPRQDIQSNAPVLPLANPADPGGWHASASQTGVAMRRARWIDVWIEGADLHIEAGFQDSATDPAGGRVAVHEYLVSAVADAGAASLTQLEANPRILPYRECPAAAGNVSAMIGQPLTAFRSSVLAALPGTSGCTHLNDVLRALADVPHLSLMLERHTAGPR
jgi:hypothetical protein